MVIVQTTYEVIYHNGKLVNPRCNQAANHFNRVIINAGSPFWVVKPSSNYTSIFVVAKSEIKYTNYDIGCFLFPIPNPPYHF